MKKSLALALKFSKHSAVIDINFFDAFQSVSDFLEEPEIKAAYWGDIAMGLVLMVVGALGTIIRAFKASSGAIDSKMITTVTDSNTNIF